MQKQLSSVYFLLLEDSSSSESHKYQVPKASYFQEPHSSNDDTSPLRTSTLHSSQGPNENLSSAEKIR